ncbi:hypothetical protein G9A89_005666 [Geosiphon pyriformis]|nr:hypothetical protein G9A89_005666 [Geosiphon pyriformis]
METRSNIPEISLASKLKSEYDEKKLEKEIFDDENENESPMKNTPWWRIVQWGCFALLNFAFLIISFALIGSFKSDLYKGNITETTYDAILIFECLPRTINLYQIYQYTGGQLKFREIIGVICGKKEGYLLFGHKNLTQRQINRLSLVSDLICFVYFIFMAWAIGSDYGSVARNKRAESKMNSLTYAVMLIAFIMIMRHAIKSLKKIYSGFISVIESLKKNYVYKRKKAFQCTTTTEKLRANQSLIYPHNLVQILPTQNFVHDRASQVLQMQHPPQPAYCIQEQYQAHVQMVV